MDKPFAHRRTFSPSCSCRSVLITLYLLIHNHRFYYLRISLCILIIFLRSHCQLYFRIISTGLFSSGFVFWSFAIISDTAASLPVFILGRRLSNSFQRHIFHSIMRNLLLFHCSLINELVTTFWTLKGPVRRCQVILALPVILLVTGKTAVISSRPVPRS